MDFTSKLGEQEYLRAAKFNRRSSVNSTVGKILLGVFVFFCLTLVFAIVMKTRANSDEKVAQERAPVTVGLIVQQVGPVGLIIALWVVLLCIWPNMRLRSVYRKSQALQGEVTVHATTEAFSVQTSTGSTSRTPWCDMRAWHEREGLVLLIYPTKIYQIVNMRNLSELQRDEFRGILTAALPRRK